jgi:lipoic acid synthetase
MTTFKNIPIVKDDIQTGLPRSGQKYTTQQGFAAIKDGIKASAGNEPLVVGRKPPWLRAPMPTGDGFDAVRALAAKKPNVRISASAGTRAPRPSC